MNIIIDYSKKIKRKFRLDRLLFLFYIHQLFAALLGRGIIVNAMLSLRRGKFRNYNWGDDLNVYFLQNLTRKKLFIIPTHRYLSMLWPDNYLCIGSTIQYRVNAKTIIWGSGVISDKIEMPTYPKKVLAVRGPLTRKYLLNKGVDCPEIYGDPALLLSRYYKPQVTKKYKLGIIPHVVDRANIYLQDFLLKYDCVKFIDLGNYSDWRSIINEVCSCDFVISSSLHGLIVSDSYMIPNSWVKFSDELVGGDFKFLDYFASVNRNISRPYVIDKVMDFNELLLLKTSWTEPEIDLEKLIEVCPF